jgi:hypothetical protein
MPPLNPTHADRMRKDFEPLENLNQSEQLGVNLENPIFHNAQARSGLSRRGFVKIVVCASAAASWYPQRCRSFFGVAFAGIKYRLPGK